MSLDKEREVFTKAGIEMYDSLVTAMEKAGGKCGKHLLDYTVLELITRLSVNNIRFVYEPPKPAKPPKEQYKCVKCGWTEYITRTYGGDNNFKRCCNCDHETLIEIKTKSNTCMNPDTWNCNYCTATYRNNCDIVDCGAKK